MRSSPLQLKKYYTTELSFSAHPGFESAGQDAGSILHSDLKVDVQWKEKEQERQRICLLSIELNDPSGVKFPCAFSISLVGLFEVVPEWPEHQVDVLFRANAPALLYSAAREAIAAVTGRGPYLQMVLPSVTFVELPKEKESITDAKSPQLEQPSTKTESTTTKERPNKPVSKAED